MIFSSLPFLFLFLPVLLLIYYAIPAKNMWVRNLALLIAGLIFFGWNSPLYMPLFAVIICVNYIFGRIVGKYTRSVHEDEIGGPAPGGKKRALFFCVAFNIVILVFFRYYGFIAESFAHFGLNLPKYELAMPWGVSFVALSAISYVFDIYRGHARQKTNFATFGAYLAMFPRLIVGPAARYSETEGELDDREHSVRLFAAGVRTFIAGLAKVVILAVMSQKLWQAVLAVPRAELTIVGSWFGILAFGFSVYFYLSGASDMAIGLGKMLGFKFAENFDYPFMSKSITEFWRKWFISVTNWFRHYIFKPIRGEKNSIVRSHIGLLVVFLLLGLWHGASWNFVLWGVYFFALVAIEGLAPKKATVARIIKKIPPFLGHIYVVFFVMVGWFIFAMNGISDSAGYFRTMFGSGALYSQADIYELLRNAAFIVICALAASPIPKAKFYKTYETTRCGKVFSCVFGTLLFIICVSYLVDFPFVPFVNLAF